MKVLHGTWLPPYNGGQGSFFIWAETTLSTSIKRKGRPPTIKSHPFQASQNELSDDIKFIYFKDNSIFRTKIRLVNNIFLLPSYLKLPLASPDLIREKDNNNELGESFNIIPWEIKGLQMPAEEAFLFLASLVKTHADRYKVRIGTDLWFWSKVSQFALELLSKQRFIPGILKNYAKWNCILSRMEDKERMEMLIESMPGVCIAFLQNNQIFDSKEVLLYSFLNSSMNNYIQSWISFLKINYRKNSISKEWLKSLTTGQPMECTISGFNKVFKSLNSWVVKTNEEKNTTFKTCFRLESPGEEEQDSNSWLLCYFLQATDDPSLLVPAEKVWGEKKKTLEFLNHKFNHPQEQLLKDLGIACRIFAPIERSLLSATPVSALLTIKEAYQFLEETGLLLQESGFGVLVPPWWKGHKTQTSIGLRLNLKVKRIPKSSKGVLHFNSIINYEWQVALGDTPLSKEELETIAELKSPLVRIRGKWVELKRDNIEKALNFFKTKKSGKMELSKVLRITTGFEDVEQDLLITGYHASGALSKQLQCLTGNSKIEEISQPNDFIGKLRSYQKKGFSWLYFLRQYGLGACLADDMGLGKTIQLIALLLKEKDDGISSPSLLICPTSIIGNWKREMNRFAPTLKVLIHHGSNRQNKDDFCSNVNNYDLIISSYGLTHREEAIFNNIEWNCLILDEAQNIKNYYTKQSQAVRKIKASYRVVLTGTPVENRLSELWSIMEFLNPGYLGSIKTFQKQFSLPIERYNNIETKNTLKNIVKPFILRRLKNDPTIISDLPEKIESNIYCNLTKEQATLYQATVNDLLRKIDIESGIKRKGLVLSALTRLKQVCNHPAQFLGDGSVINGRSGKLNRLTEMLEEIISEGHSTLVFTQYAKMGEIIKKHLQKRFNVEIFYLHGGVPQKSRDKMIVKFSKMNGSQIFILSLKAGGLGLNLTKASHVFHFDRWWNPAVENQATDRAFRIGQKKNVMVYKFICEGTLEERIDELIINKKELVESIIGTGESWLTEMSTNQLKDLLTLRQNGWLYE